MPRPPGYDLRQAKAAMNQRLHAERRWTEYQAIREQLKREGVSQRDAWRIAAQSFPPLDGSPIEVDSPLPVGSSQLSQVPTDEPDADEFWFDTVSEKAGAPAGPPVPPPAPTNGGWTVYAQDVKGQMLDEQTAWLKLVAAVDKTKRAQEREVIDWVFNNAVTPYAAIDPVSVPSMGALGLLRMVKTGSSNYVEFIRSTWSKVIPTKSQLESEGRFNDDGRQQLSMLEEFEREYAEGNPDGQEKAA